MQKKDILIEGEKISLLSLKEQDVYGRWWQWFNDKEVTRYLNKGQEENTIKKQMEFFLKVKTSDNDFILGICDESKQKHIGTTGIHNIRIEENGKVGNFGIIIGEKEYWGKGIGTEAWYLMIEYAFENLGLDSIETKIFTNNITALKIAKKIGFKVIDILKKEVVKNDKKIDRILLRLDKNFWSQNIKGTL